MKNPIIILTIIAVAAVLGIGTYALSQYSSQPESMMEKDEAMLPKETTVMEDKTDGTVMEKDTVSTETSDKMMGDTATNSRYVEYSKASLGNASGNRRVLFFYASWCPTCKPTDANLKANTGKIPNDVTVIRINYNDPETDQEEKDLAKKYGITYQHTFVQIDSEGNEVAKWNGGKIDELLAKIK